MGHHEREGQRDGRGDGGGCCGGEGKGDHAEYTAQMLERAHARALEELYVDAIKAKLKASGWAKRIDGVASAAVSALTEEWEAFHKGEAARAQLKEKLRKSFEGRG